MENNLYGGRYNPDILLCLANLSNDEVFTPPEIANKMLDMLPRELFSNSNTKFLDPASKSGVFSREIAKRLNEGLKDIIPDAQERVNHIFHNQIYGIAITELTSLLSRRSIYCSKYPNSIFSVTNFDDLEGNIRYKRIKHHWKNGSCVFCRVSQSQYDRDSSLETHAYEFIHTLKPEEIFKMKFDVIIANPPYQLSDGGAQASAIPLYHKFVEQAKKLNPSYITMIIPSRWFSGGKGLDKFRKDMLKDKKIRKIVDFQSSAECFPGVDIQGGVNYFLWERGYNGKCEVVNMRDGKVYSELKRDLLIEDLDVFIRDNVLVNVLKKIKDMNEDTFEKYVSARKPFGLDTKTQIKLKSDKESDLIIYANKQKGFIDYERINTGLDKIKQYKIFVSYAYGYGDKAPHQVINWPFIPEYGSVCTETYLTIGEFKNEIETENAVEYMKTKFFRAIVYILKNTQHATKKVYSFVPIQDFSEKWTDEKLYKKYNLNKNEIDYIETTIRPMTRRDENER